MNPIVIYILKATLLVSAILSMEGNIYFIVIAKYLITTKAAVEAKLLCIYLFNEFQIFSKTRLFPTNFPVLLRVYKGSCTHISFGL